MAIVKANYCKRGINERATAKANIRYIQERPGRDTERPTRVLFGSAGFIGRYEAYQFIDEEAKKGSFFYRIKLSPDPAREDTRRDLHMQKLTRDLMQSLEKRLNTAVPWAGALHDDHTDVRHVHVLAAVPRRLHKHELEFLIKEATQACLEQRRGLDFGATLAAWRERRQQRIWNDTQKPGRTYLTYPRARAPWLMPRGGRPARVHTSCTCPRCHFPQSHDRYGVHTCMSCGLMLHKKRERSLQQRKGVGWERQR